MAASPFPGQAALSPSSRDSLVTASIGDARILIPFLADDSASADLCEMIFNGLTKVDRDLRIVSDAAGRWEISPDGKTYTFYLRDGVRWQDGWVLSADDVAYTFRALADPANGSPYAASYADIEAVEVLDPLTIRFRYKEVYAPALSKLGMGILPAHRLEGQPLRSSPFARRPLGTGPYRLHRWRTDEYAVLTAHDEYFERPPGLARRVTRIIPDPSVAFLELLTGGVDAASLTPDQFRHYAQRPDFQKRFATYTIPTQGYTYIGYNLEDPLFADARVRRALGMAIDRQQIIDGILLGLGRAITGPFVLDTPWYDASVTGLSYDPAQARRLLAEAGWRDANGDGILDRDGRPFRFKLVTNEGNQVREDVAALVQRQWRQIGVDVEIQTIAWVALLDQWIKPKRFQALILGWSLPIDPDPTNVWHSSATAEAGLNFLSYRNPEADRLMERGVRTLDPAARADIYHQLHRLIAEDQPMTFLFSPLATVAIDRRVKGVTPAPAGLEHNHIEWHVDPGDVKYDF